MKSGRILLITLCLLPGLLLPAAVSAEANPCADGHDFEEGVVTFPGCTEPGFTTYTCSRCGEVYTEPGEAATGHDYTAEATTPATAESEGIMTYTCTRCGDSYTEPIPELDPELQEPAAPAEPEEEPPAQAETVPAEPEAEPPAQEETDPAADMGSGEKAPEEDWAAEHPVFRQMQSIDGVVVTVKAEAGVFPEDAVLSVVRAPSPLDDTAIETDNISYTFDIRVLAADGSEIQPAEGKTVRIFFCSEEAEYTSEHTRIWLISDDGSKEEMNITDAGETETEGVDEETAAQTVCVETDRLALFTLEFLPDSLPVLGEPVYGESFRADIQGVYNADILPGAKITIDYNGAPEDGYVSALLLDENGTVLLSTSMDDPITEQNTAGSWIIQLPDNLAMGRHYTLQVFCEQERGSFDMNSASPSSDILLRVLFLYTVTTDVGTGTSSMVLPENTNVIAIASCIKGYTFLNWTENGVVVSSDEQYHFTLTGDRNLTANFVPDA